MQNNASLQENAENKDEDNLFTTSSEYVSSESFEIINDVKPAKLAHYEEEHKHILMQIGNFNREKCKKKVLHCMHVLHSLI